MGLSYRRRRSTTRSTTPRVQAPADSFGTYTLRADQLSMARRMVETVRANGAAILCANAGVGKSLIQGCATRMLFDAVPQPALALHIFHTHKIASENHAMFGIANDEELMTARLMSAYADGSRRNRKTHLLGMASSTFSTALKPVDDDAEEEGGASMHTSPIVTWVLALGLKTLAIVVDECHTLTAQNSSRNCRNVAHLREYLTGIGVRCVVMGNSATPEATASLHRKRAGSVITNMTAVYGVEHASDITVVATEEERRTSAECRWQGEPDNPTFTETHVLGLDDTFREKVYEFFLNGVLFTTPTSDGMRCDIPDLRVWVVLYDASAHTCLCPTSTVYEFLKNAETRRARRKTNTDRLLLHMDEEEVLEEEDDVDYTKHYVEFGGVKYTPKLVTTWQAKTQQVSVRTRMNAFFNRIEIDSFMKKRFTVTELHLSDRTGFVDLHTVTGVEGHRVTGAVARSTYMGCILLYVPTKSVMSIMRAKIEAIAEDPDEPCQWHDLVHDDRNVVDRRIHIMQEKTKEGSTLQLGLLSPKHTIGTNAFAKNAHGIVIVGGCVDETRKRHLSGRIARPVLPEVGDVFANTPRLQHARNKLLSDLQASMESVETRTITFASREYVDLHTYVSKTYSKEDARSFTTLFDTETGRPFDIVKGRDLAHDFVQALDERRWYQQRLGGGEEEGTAWEKRFGDLQDMMREVGMEMRQFREQVNPRKRPLSD